MTYSNIKQGILYFGIISIVIFIILIFIQSTTVLPTTKNTEVNNTTKQYNVFPPEIPEKIDFAGENVPLNFFDVRESLDNELLASMYWHSNTFRWLKRAKRWFPVIEPILKANNIPDDFKYLAVIESGLTNAVSPAGASGFWQFLASTGKSYGMEINSYVDERYNLEIATHAACKYLQDAYNDLGYWTMAAASYNKGIPGIKKQINRQENDTNYYDLLLNAETARYVYRIIAAKIIFSNPKKYGFNLSPKDYYYPVPVKIITIDTAIQDIPAFAQKYGLSYKMFKLLNPWLRDTYLTNRSGKNYKIIVPKNSKYRNINHIYKTNKIK